MNTLEAQDRIRDSLGAIMHSHVVNSYASIEATPEDKLQMAFATGTFLNGLMAAYRGDPIKGLAGIRSAMPMGFDPGQARKALELVHALIDEQLQHGGRDLVHRLFNVGNLAALRYVEAQANYPAVSDRGREFDIVVTENAPLYVLREVWVQPFLAAVPEGDGAQETYAKHLRSEAAGIGVDASRRAEALVTQAAVAVSVDDFVAGVSLTAQALAVDPNNGTALTAAAFMWLIVFAQARDGTLVDAAKAPTWWDLVAILRGALRYEARHQSKTQRNTSSRSMVAAS